MNGISDRSSAMFAGRTEEGGRKVIVS